MSLPQTAHTLCNSLLGKASLAWNWNTNWIQQPTSGSSDSKQAKAESSAEGSKPQGPVGKEGHEGCELQSVTHI